MNQSIDLKAVVLDIDGTLLNDKKELTIRTKQILIKAQEKGIKVILASGRPPTGMQKYADELELKKYEGFLVSYNGAMVTECKTNNILFNQSMSVENSKRILEHMKKFEVIPMINKDSYLYVNNVYNNILNLQNGDFNIIEYEARGGNFKLCEIEDLADFVDFPLNKILIAAEPEYLNNNYMAMKKPFIDELSAMFTAPFYFEFTDKGIDKAKALNSVFPNIGIGSNNMIAFGDGQNDHSIVEYAKIGVAMGNAVEGLKKVANYITLSNNEDGIAVYLENYIE